MFITRVSTRMFFWSDIAIGRDGATYTGVYASCAAPTLEVGDSAFVPFCATKTDASGHSIFSVQIGGIGTAYPLIVDQGGNVYLAGAPAGPTPTGLAFATTPGAYEPTLPLNPYAGGFVCRLSGEDGHPLFCTYTDPLFSFVAASSDGVYLAGGGCFPNATDLCVAKLNPTGTALEYVTNTGLSSVFNGGPLGALDTQGNLFVAQPNELLKLNPSGAVINRTALPYSQLMGLAVDPAGEPQVLVPVQADTGYSSFLVRRYAADLSTVLFDAQVSFPGNLSGLAIDPDGITDLWGATSNVNLPVVHPTGTCLSGSNAFLIRVGNDGSTLQSTLAG